VLFIYLYMNMYYPKIILSGSVSHCISVTHEPHYVFVTYGYLREITLYGLRLFFFGIARQYFTMCKALAR